MYATLCVSMSDVSPVPAIIDHCDLLLVALSQRCTKCIAIWWQKPELHQYVEIVSDIYQ